MEDKSRELERTESLNSFHGSYSKSVTSGLTGDSHSFDEKYLWERQTDFKFQWKNRWQNTAFFLSITLSWTSLVTFDIDHKIFPKGNSINILQLILMYVFFGYPVVFLKTFLGQFSRKGCLAIGQMMPIAAGLGYLTLVTTFLSAIYNLYFCSILLFYVLMATANSPIPSWMLCLRSYLSLGTNCMGRREIDLCHSCESKEASAMGPCFDSDRQNLSSYLFFKNVVFNFEKFDSDHVLDLPDKMLVIHLGVTVLLLFITILRDARDLDAPIKIWNALTHISLIIMTVVISFSSLRVKGILFFFQFKWQSLVDIKCWTKTIAMVIMCLNLSEGSHFLFGSFTPVTTNTINRTFFLCLVKFGALILFHIFLFISTENFLCKINTKLSTFSDMSIMVFVLAVYPEALGILASAPFWGFLYFLIAFGLSFQAIILQIITIETSVSQVAFKSSYRLYIRCIILIVMTAGTLLLLTPEGTKSSLLFYTHLFPLKITVVFLYLLVTFTYGFQKLYDDIHFLLRHPPSVFFRYTWFINLVLTGLTLIYYLVNGNFTEGKPIFYFIFIVLLGSLLVGFMFKFVEYLKAKDLSSLLSPAETWGPTEQESRIVRKLFNPRFEIRCRRQEEWCNHRSLVGNSILKRTLEKEVALVSNVLLEIEDDEEERKLKKELVEALRMHRMLLSKFLAERALGEKAIILKRHNKE